ncbi:MAG TPA: glycosyltransferase [Balneolales bacterium]|nr:glycosyltransferase [Balneolales bacterium]
MNVLMVVEGFGSDRFGVEKVVENISENLIQHDWQCDIVTMVIDGTLKSAIESHVHQVPYWNFTRPLRFHPAQYLQVKALVQDLSPDIVHCHGCFSWLQVASIWAARKQPGKVILLSAHGMLEPWLWRQKGSIYNLMKRLFWNLLLKPTMAHVDYVHAITDQEADTFAKEFPGVRQIRISNAIDLSEYNDQQEPPDEKRYLFFIGRLHPKKGLDLLINAFARMSDEGVRLVIAGPDFDPEYTRELKSLVQKWELSERVNFVGSVYGEAKSTLLKKAWCTVVPSYSDVVALVNLESAASFTPTITTTMTGLSDWEEGGGLLVEPEVEALYEAIATVCKWSAEERMKNGRVAREFVEQRYSWDVVGEQWIEAYKMMAESGRQHEQ